MTIIFNNAETKPTSNCTKSEKEIEIPLILKNYFKLYNFNVAQKLHIEDPQKTQNLWRWCEENLNMDDQFRDNQWKINKS